MPPLSPAAEDYAGDRRSRGFVTVPDAIPLKWRGLLFYARSEAGISFIADKAELRHACPADVGQHFIHRHVTRSRIGLELEFRFGRQAQRGGELLAEGQPVDALAVPPAGSVAGDSAPALADAARRRAPAP